MPLILSIETATPVVSVALHQGGELITAIEHHVPRSHSTTLPIMVKQVLKMQKEKTEKLVAIAVSAGPGSYTGLRVGIALAKGLCYGKSVPLISINTLVTMVQSKLAYPLDAGVWCPLLDARQGNAYGLVANAQGQVLTPTYKWAVTPNTFEKWLVHQPVYFIGSSAENHVQTLKKHPNSRLVKGVYPQASHMGKLAYTKFLQKDFVDIATFDPLYTPAENNKQTDNPI